MSNKVILQNLGEYEIYNSPALVALSSASVYGSTNLSNAIIYGNTKVDYQWALNEIHCYQVMILLISATFLAIYLLQAAEKIQ